jgi:hypothetical protein
MTGRSLPSERSLFLYLGALLLIASSFGQALWDAVESGTVVVMQVGKIGTTTEVVPWREGWSRFAGPLLLLAALEVWRRLKRFRTSLLMTASGAVLIFCSIWFTSLQRVASFLVWNAVIFTSLIIGKRFGWLAVFAFLAACFAIETWVRAGQLRR